MLKPVIAATAALAIVGSTYVYAQQRFDGHGGFGRAEHQHRQLSADDVNAFADARIAALKAGLELTPDQDKNWPSFEQALRNMVQLRVQRIQARQAAGAQGTQIPNTNASNTNVTNPFDRMSNRADAMTKRGAALKQIADAGAPLYQSLNDAQKARFTMLARILRPHEHRHAMNDGDQNGQRWDHQRFGEGGPGFQGGQGDGQGWGHRHFGENGHGGMHSMNSDDQDSKL